VKHFSSPLRTSRDEQRVRRMQAGFADGFSVRDAALGQPVAVIVGVSPQLDISHGFIVPPGPLGSSGPDWDALRLAIDSAVILLGSANYRSVRKP
jgi:hypothetical protein